MAKLVAKRYAEALFEVAVENGNLEQTREEIQFVAEVFESNPELKTIFVHPRLSKKEKKGMLEELFKGKISESVLNLGYITVDKGREGYLSEISREFNVLSNAEQGIVEAKAITAVPMTEDELNALEERLSKRFNKRIQLSNLIDESVIGGVLLKIGDKVMDGSIKGKMEDIEKELKNIKVSVE
jgi:F-type H+-transporting ATPase subunit delta